MDPSKVKAWSGDLTTKGIFTGPLKRRFMKMINKSKLSSLPK